MNKEYTQRETVTIKGKSGEPLMDVDCEVVGLITQDVKEVNGRERVAWFHNGYIEVRMKMWDGQYKRIDGRAAEAVYDAFCKQHPAWELAQQEAA